MCYQIPSLADQGQYLATDPPQAVKLERKLEIESFKTSRCHPARRRAHLARPHRARLARGSKNREFPRKEWNVISTGHRRPAIAEGQGRGTAGSAGRAQTGRAIDVARGGHDGLFSGQAISHRVDGDRRLRGHGTLIFPALAQCRGQGLRLGATVFGPWLAGGCGLNWRDARRVVSSILSSTK